MPRKKNSQPEEEEFVARSADEIAQQVEEDTAEVELEKAQKRIAREERRARREIEKQKQKKALWVLPIVLLATVFFSWLLSAISFSQ
ncbi:MAG: hypothetical protein LBG64_03295 [Pseudomonadales bacterium]|jgi:cytoskeletal protein RodZ|nr:hypothetical protein [Pseudomonadales bacterium]